MTALLVAIALLQDSDPPRRMTVDLPEDGSLVMAGEVVPWKEVAASFRKFRDAGMRSVVIRADGSVPFSSVVRVMDAAREAGLENVEISTEKPKGAPKFAEPDPPAIRIKIREGTKGLELRILRESGAGSLDALKEALLKVEKTSIVIDAEDGVSYDVVQQVAKACTDSGFEKISFASAAKKAERLRVFVADRTPRYEFRYLRSFLERSAGFKADFHLASADPDFPMNDYPADLTRYDVVILGPLADLDPKRQKALVEFVKGGGGLVWMGAADEKKWLGHALEEICPVRVKNIEFAPVALVAKAPEHPILKDWNMPEAKANSGWKAEAVDADATVLLDPGFLVVQEVGRGRVAYVGSDDTWRWRYLVGDQPHFAPFWLRVIEWCGRRR